MGRDLLGYWGKNVPEMLLCDPGCRGEGSSCESAVASEIYTRQDGFSPELIWALSSG